jgi:ribosomal-protein-alanine N-acetyltransferase
MTYRLPDSPAVLSADGVHLRRFAENDVALLLAATRDPEIVRWTFIPADLDERRARLLVQRGLVMEGEGRFHRYVISASPDAPSAGQVVIVLQDDDDPRCADIVYWLLPEARGRGLVTRAVRLLIRWAFDEAGVSKLALYTRRWATTARTASPSAAASTSKGRSSRRAAVGSSPCAAGSFSRRFGTS